MFEVHVSKDTFKFNAAHFVAYPGFRERLHGHNYRVSVCLLGERKIGPDGYLIDFGCVKDVTKKVCKELNEHFLCPILSNVIQITTEKESGNHESVRLICEDGSIFVFPKSDCAMLPIVHATTEELAIYLWGRILHGLDAGYLVQRGIHTMEVTVAEAVGQDATFRLEIPTSDSSDHLFDVSQYIMTGDVVPMPCPSNPDIAGSGNHFTKTCWGDCTSCQSKLSLKLEQLAEIINNGKLKEKTEPLTANDLEALISDNSS
jgi:6-pyruvoyltetrahydropterin/6-carboxytetrahydropterin synthase